eukprot:6172205-Pleurochrysis_carterae.AAC.2
MHDAKQKIHTDKEPLLTTEQSFICGSTAFVKWHRYVTMPFGQRLTQPRVSPRKMKQSSYGRSYLIRLNYHQVSWLAVICEAGGAALYDRRSHEWRRQNLNVHSISHAHELRTASPYERHLWWRRLAATFAAYRREERRSGRAGPASTFLQGFVEENKETTNAGALQEFGKRSIR